MSADNAVARMGDEGCTCVPIPDGGPFRGCWILTPGCPIHDPRGEGDPDVKHVEKPLEDLGELPVVGGLS